MAKKKRRPPNYWTQDRVIAAMHRWKREHGKLPKNTEWASAGSYWPSQATVYRVFPSWVKAVEMAKMDVKVERRAEIVPGPIDMMLQRMQVMESNLTRQMAEIRMMLDKQPEPANGNGHSHEPNLIARILGKAA
jgi:hypothetical protein